MKSKTTYKIKSFSILCCLFVLFLTNNAYSQITYAKKIATNISGIITIPSNEGGYLSAGESVFWMKKTDPFGQTTWEKRLSFEKDDFNISGITQTLDGGYVSVGGQFETWYGIAIKLGSSGDIQWMKKYSTDRDGISFSRGIALNNGGFIAAGSTYFPSSIVLVKFNSSGFAILASRLALFNVNLGLNDFVRAADGGFFLVGYTEDNRVLVIRINERTEILWSQLYEVENFFYPRIAATPDNGAIITGIDNYSDGGKLLLLKLTNDGQVEWKKRLSFSGGKIHFPSVNLASDSGYLITGRYLTGTYNDEMKMFLLKTDSTGDFVFAKTFPKTQSSGSYHGWSAFPDLMEGSYLMAPVWRTMVNINTFLN
jgi:hypothetical protein